MSIRVAGINIPNKRLEIALTYVYGIGKVAAQKICKDINVSPNQKVADLTEEQILRLRSYIDKNCTVEGDLRREVSMNIKQLVDIGCYRGIRHRKKLPVRGQRTHTNARTRKGKAVAIAGKKQVSKK